MNEKRRLFAIYGIVTLGLASRGPAQAKQQLSDSISQPAKPNDRSFISRSFEMQRLAIELGDQGYGAVVVRESRIVGQSPSHVILNRDPTAHAEMEAIRDAAKRLGSRDLSGCTLYSSSRACPMCEAAAYWAGITRMVHGKAIADAGHPSLCG